MLSIISFENGQPMQDRSRQKTKNHLRATSETNKAQKQSLIQRARYPSLVWALTVIFWKKLALSCVFKLLRDMLIFVGPLLLRYDEIPLL